MRFEIGIASIWHLSLTDEIFNSFHNVSDKLLVKEIAADVKCFLSKTKTIYFE